MYHHYNVLKIQAVIYSDTSKKCRECAAELLCDTLDSNTTDYVVTLFFAASNRSGSPVE